VVVPLGRSIAAHEPFAEALRPYEGTALVVSHDRAFVERFFERSITFLLK
jgi:ATPase subunit of ABC transporter with duplicated ATPase domains